MLLYPPDIHPANPPGFDQFGPDFIFVKLDSWLVPIEHMPFDPSVIPFLGNLDQALQQGRADSRFSILRYNEQILEKEPRFTDKRRVIPKIKSKPNDNRLMFCQQHFNT